MTDSLTLHEVRALNRGREPDDAYHRAAAFLAAGRLEIITKTHRVLEAEAIGTQGDRYYLRGDLEGIRCSCPAWFHRHTCSHVDALRLVCAEPGYRRLRPTTNEPGGLFTRGTA